jgi:hypothetical protein
MADPAAETIGLVNKMSELESRFLSLLPPSVSEQARDSVGELLMREYGAIFAAGNGVEPPDRLIFRDEGEVAAFQNRVETGTVRFGEITIELQEKAAEALRKAVAAVRDASLSITPRSADSGRRSYSDTVGLWHSRVEPALIHWVAQNELTIEQAEDIRRRPRFEQVPIVLSLEERGLFFAKDLSKSIIYSVAPPGASQHLSMLAFDVTEFNDPLVRGILSDHRWYQTVISDLPHFTFLGFSANELPGRGLKKVFFADRVFWLPELDKD